MPTLVMIDGQLVAEEHARVSVFDRGFLYGDSVFETIRTYDGGAVCAGATTSRGSSRAPPRCSSSCRWAASSWNAKCWKRCVQRGTPRPTCA